MLLPYALGRVWVRSLNKPLAGECYEPPKPLLLQQNNSPCPLLSQPGLSALVVLVASGFGGLFLHSVSVFLVLEGHKTGHSVLGMVCCVLGREENPFLASSGCTPLGVYPCEGLKRKGYVNWRPKQVLTWWPQTTLAAGTFGYGIGGIINECLEG